MGNKGRDALYGSWNDDALWGKYDDDVLDGGAGRDTLMGNQGQDRLFGGEDTDFLYGCVGGDQLDGGAGSDRLYGGRADDTLRGGSGADVFIFAGEPQHHDRIPDFNPEEDALRFHPAYAGTLELTRAGFDTVITYGAPGQNSITLEWHHLTLAQIELQWIGS